MATPREATCRARRFSQATRAAADRTARDPRLVSREPRGSDDQFHEKSVAVLANELLTAQAYGAAFVNVHIGSHRGTGPEQGAQRVALTVARAFDETAGGAPDPVLALENSAGGGFGLGGTIEELALVLEAIEACGVPRHRIALCLDTAHLWGAGYDISTDAGVDAFLDRLTAVVGLERLAMMHLNDSRSDLGSHMDRHQHVGAGRIGAAGMAAILRSPRLAAVPVYLETPGMDEGYDAVNLARCRDLLAGRPLADLPDEALELPGSRSRSAPQREPGDEDEDDVRRHPRRRSPPAADTAATSAPAAAANPARAAAGGGTGTS